VKHCRKRSRQQATRILTSGIFLRADRSVDYGALMDVMSLLRAAGYLKVALVGIETAAASTSPQ
jgi:biopolymer transport protein ExbD